jgi:hypothetical protein
MLHGPVRKFTSSTMKAAADDAPIFPVTNELILKINYVIVEI